MEDKHEKYQRLIDYCKVLPAMPTAVVHPCDESSLDVGHALLFKQVRVAVLSAMETVNPKVPSAVEAAALCKMVDRHSVHTRLASCAVAALVAKARRESNKAVDG